MRITIRPKRIQHTGIDDTFRTLAARKRDDQEFDTTGQFQNVGHEFVGKIGSPGDIKIGDCTIERGKALGDSRANAPHPDDTHGLAGDPRYERHAAFGPISFTQKSVSTRDSPCDRQQQTDSHVGDISSQHVRCVGHPNPIRRGEGEIDRIRTNAVARHNLELGKSPAPRMACAVTRASSKLQVPCSQSTKMASAPSSTRRTASPYEA
jgi:hypothetical protein